MEKRETTVFVSENVAKIYGHIKIKAMFASGGQATALLDILDWMNREFEKI